MRKVERVLKASDSLLPGGFTVRRALPRRDLRRVGAFVFLDHFDESDVTPETFDVPPHPHVGLQTVTYLYAGEILHTDSLGSETMISPGDINWMTAGAGITHAEQVVKREPRLHGLQIWIGLPHAFRDAPPAFDHFDESSLPLLESDGVRVRAIAGSCGPLVSPIPTFQELLYLDVQANRSIEYEFVVNANHELAFYVTEGGIDVEGTTLEQYDLGLLGPGSSVTFRALRESRFVLIGGEPLPEPTVIYWNFITNTIDDAKAKLVDWENRKFPPVPHYRQFDRLK